MTPARTASRPQRAGGFTLTEAMLAAVVVAIVFAGALHAVASSGADRVRAAQRASAAFLADGLTSEILSHSYSASGGGGGGGGVVIKIGGLDILLGGGEDVITIDGGAESPASPARLSFTTVDEYHGLVDSPPTDVDGAAIKGFTGWSRTVTVETVSPVDGSTVVGTDQGLKRITVRVYRNGGLIETRRVLLSSAP